MPALPPPHALTKANPHRAGTKAAARWAKRQAREDAKAAHATALALAREAAVQLARPPRELGDWGVTRTRAWAACSQKLRRMAALKHPKLDALQVEVQQMRDLISGALSLEACVRTLEAEQE